MRIEIEAIMKQHSETGAIPSFGDFDKRAKAGERLTVAFLGGSLTWGARSSDPQRTSYRAIVGRKLETIYPKAHFKFIDAAIGGTGSQLGAFRFQRDVMAYKPDLMFLDFTLNDGVHETTPDTLAAQEGIIRRAIEGSFPVVQMLLAAREFVTEGTTERMKRRAAHIAIAEAYGIPCGDAISLMQERYKKGELDLDKVWPPEFFDTCHPNDPGYELYAEAAWNAFMKAVTEKMVCKVPGKMLHGNTYMHVARVRISSLAPLPQGWRVAIPSRDYCAFDFLMSRWLDDVSVAANFVETARDITSPCAPAQPLKMKFHGSSVMLFGESTARSCKCRVLIDGAESQFDACQLGQGTGRMLKLIAEGLDPAVEHSMELHPVFESPDKPQELRIESICVAGGKAKVQAVR